MSPDPGPDPIEPTPAPRVLFLDDDPARAEVFLAGRPGAAWVRTVEECVAKLAESWDEVHLDHDLGGETFVASHREDCGMAVVRWLCREPRPHLEPARFIVHSFNRDAAFAMTFQLTLAGYRRVVACPFGEPIPAEPGPEPAAPPPAGLWDRLWGRLTRRAAPPGEADPDCDPAGAMLESPIATAADRIPAAGPSAGPTDAGGAP